MSRPSRTVQGLVLIGAMALAVPALGPALAPALAKDLIIIDGPITADDVVCSSCIHPRDIRNSAVTTQKIKNKAVTSNKIRNGAVGASEIGNNAVGTAEIQGGAVTNSKIGAAAVGTANIQDKSITLRKLADGVLPTGGIGPGSVGTAELQDGAVTNPKIAGGAVTSAKIANGTVTSADIADLTVTGNDIANGTITLNKLAFGTAINEIEPFRVVNATGGLCDSGLQGASNPQIEIDNTGLDEFVVTGILIKTSSVPTQGFVALSVDSVAINNFRFDTRTDSLVGPTDGAGVFESADLMGTPVRRGPLGTTAGPGGNFPHQIVASAVSDGADIVVTLFCQSDLVDLSITAVAVSGWKFSNDTVTLNYKPGT